MIVISDTSVLCYLVLINQIQVLEHLYEKIVILSRSRGLRVTGLIGILDDAAGSGLIDLPKVLEALQTTSFWVSPRVIQSLLEKHGYNP